MGRAIVTLRRTCRLSQRRGLLPKLLWVADLFYCNWANRLIGCVNVTVVGCVVVQARPASTTTKVIKAVRSWDAGSCDAEMGLLNRLFEAHGQLCASRPWEVIIATLTVILCTTSLSLFAASNKICDWNYRCERGNHDDDVRIDTTDTHQCDLS